MPAVFGLLFALCRKEDEWRTRLTAPRLPQQDQREPFADDVLERLARSNMEYQREHGNYIVPLAERLLAARAALRALVEAEWMVTHDWGGDMTAAKPPWHGNWYREWSVGRFAFEIEWVPRGHCYTFSFSINSTKKQLEKMGA